VRRSAWQNYADGYLAFKNTSAAILTTAIKQDVFMARVRRYTSSLHASLEPNNVPGRSLSQPDRCLQTKPAHLAQILARAPQGLNLDTFGVYDIKAPLTESKPVVPYEQAVDWICEGMAPLGEGMLPSCGAAAWKTAGSTGRATAASARARSRAARMARGPLL
jgi:oligoendopeptidase F